MKTLVLILSLTAALACTALTIFIVKFKQYPKTENNKLANPQVRLDDQTLTGLRFDVANTAVKAFYDETKSSHKRSSVWFSKNWFDTIYKRLKADTTISGIRIYPSKDGTNNNLIIVAVKTDATNGKRMDYFYPDKTFTFNKRDILQELSDDADPSLLPGALLFASTNASLPAPCIAPSSDPNNIDPHSAWNFVNEFAKKDKQGINTMSEWFPIGVLDILKQDMDDAQTQRRKPDGLRIYFSKNDGTDKKYLQHKGRHCFILVPTIEFKDELTGKITSHRDDFTCNESNAHKEFMKKLFDGGEENGEECPNNCDGVTLPAN